MQIPEIPAEEQDRLRALRALDILDTEPEERFDRITRIAQHIFGVPISLVSLVDEDRQWFKSRQGLDATQTPRDVSFCGHAILSQETLVVENATEDERFHDNPLVTEDPSIRFYAGRPLSDPDGHRLGTFCLVDREPRTLSPEELSILDDLAAMAESELQIKTMRELIERIEAATQAREQAETERQNFFDMSADLVYIGDFEGRFTQINRQWTRQLGYEPEELLGTGYLDLVHPSDRTDTLAMIQQLSGTCEITSFENRYLAKDGHYLWMEWVGLASLETGRVYAAGRDVTEQRNLELALRESNRELDAFASVASHDLQEPLRKIQTFGDRLKSRAKDKLDDRSRNYLDRMNHAADRMHRLINDLLRYSRITSQGHPPEIVQLSQVIHEVCDDLEIRLEETGGKVEVGDLGAVEADPVQMRQLFQNLIGNALKFAREEVPPRVRITRVEDPTLTHLQLVVEDNGIGFEQKYADRIFGVFQRLHGRTEFEGSGIGLAVCRRILERHQGRIRAEGREGEGARFTISFPASRIVSAEPV